METRQKPPCEEAISGPCPGSTTRPPYPTPTYGPCWTIQLDRSPAATLPSDHYHHGDGTRHGLGKQDHPQDRLGRLSVLFSSQTTLDNSSSTAVLLQPCLATVRQQPFYSPCCHTLPCLTTALLQCYYLPFSANVVHQQPFYRCCPTSSATRGLPPAFAGFCMGSYPTALSTRPPTPTSSPASVWSTRSACSSSHRRSIRNTSSSSPWGSSTRRGVASRFSQLRANSNCACAV